MNKLIVVPIAVFFLFSSCNQHTEESQNGVERVSPDIVNNPATASGEALANAKPVFSFENNNYDFGTINSGQEVVHEFKFKNTGNADLIISQAKGSCGCTSPEFPQNPVKPGEEGTIKVTFRSAGMAGQVVKDITLLANTTPTTKVLTISGEVLKIAEKE